MANFGSKLRLIPLSAMSYSQIGDSPKRSGFASRRVLFNHCFTAIADGSIDGQLVAGTFA